MKKQTFLILCILLTQQLVAQVPSAGTQTRTSVQVPSGFIVDEPVYSDAINEINSRAVRDFVRTHEKAEKVKWFKDKDLTVVYFDDHGVRARSAYTNKGRFLYKLRFLNESLLDKDTRHLIKSQYYDYTIHTIVEVDTYSGKALIVKLSDDKEYKTLRISNHELELIEVFDKQVQSKKKK